MGRLVPDIFPVIGGIPVAEVKRSDIIGLLKGIEARGKIETARITSYNVCYTKLLRNFVNATYRAQERGIRVVEAKSSIAEGFANMIRLTVTGEDGEHSVCGTVFSAEDYRIVRVDDYHVEAIPDGHILILHNDDRPGVIGFIGQTLAKGNINIAMMNLSRRKIQGKAISLINVDSRIPETLLEELRSNEHILSAVQVQLWASDQGRNR